MKNKLILLLGFVQKHKERIALIGMAVSFIVFIAGGVYLQKSGERERQKLTTISRNLVELKKKPKRSSNQGGGENGGNQVNGESQGASKTTGGRQSYFLKPSPEELLEQLENLENLTDAAIDAKYQQMPVLWKVYFFNFQETDDGRSLLYLDVSEDGFGIQIESEVKIIDYPELLDLEAGAIVWVGGKILGVDRSGTGTVVLELEQLKLGPEPPFEEKYSAAAE